MLNKCCIMGRLGQDPEIRQTQGGKPVANFSIACERDFKGADGNRETDWIRCACFGATAEFAGRYLRKGRAVCVEGRLQIRKWTDNNGQQRESAEIVVNNVYFADSPHDERQGGGGYQSQGAGQPPSNGYHGGYDGNNNQGYGRYGNPGGYSGNYRG